MTPRDLSDQSDYPCNGYPEHDYEVVGEADGWVTYRCRRCDAETWSAASDEEEA